MEDRQRFAGLLVVLFLVVGSIGLIQHEMWRDELHFWMLVKNSTSIANFFHNLRYESGHFFLWYFGLYFISRLTANPVAMQIYHLAIAALSVYLLARYSPFNRRQCLLISCGYFFVFEYAILSRNFGIGVLLVFTFCTLFPHRDRSYLPLAGVLFLLANTNLYGTMLAISLGLMLVLDGVTNLSHETRRKRRVEWLFSLAVWLTGLLLCLYQLKTPADSGLPISQVTTQFRLDRLLDSLSALWKSYVPMPGLAYQFWNTNILDNGYSSLLSIIILAFAVALFRYQPIILFLYLLGTFEILGFIYFKHTGGIRHWGYLYILFLACLWLAHYYPEVNQSTRSSPKTIKNIFLRHRHSLIAVVLWGNLIAGIFAYSMDFLHPFSEAKATASLIQSRGWDRYLVVGDRDWSTLAVAGYLGQPIYYPASQQVLPFIVWNNRRRDVSQAELLAQVHQLQQSDKRDALLVLNYPLETSATTANQLSQLATFTHSTVLSENYYLYLLKNQNLVQNEN